MLKVMSAICILLATLPVYGAPAKYQVATIMEVQSHAGSGSTAASYEVSVKVDGTIYVVLYTPPLGIDTVRYAAGRELLVQVNEKTITYNDILGQSLEVPILSRRPAGQHK